LAEREKIINKNKKRLEGAEIRYTACQQNGCWTSCLLKCYVKNGELLAIEVGDNAINSDDAREEVSEEQLRQAMIQQRPCVRGRLWRKTLDHPNRAKYPMRNIGTRGNPKWQRISWDEALDEAARMLKEVVDKYGPYSVASRLFPPQIGPWAGFGSLEWGMSSFSSHQFADAMTYGYDDTAIWYGQTSGTEAPDLLNSTLFIGFGWNPAINYYEYTYYLMRAKEKGIPIIIIDPRFTPTTQVYADQWIPIRPGTDGAMLLGMANVLFKEDTYDKAYVDKFVEPNGFKKWRDYVLGLEDGVDKTPAWAEKICGVPEETITALARLYSQHQGYSLKKPAYLKLHWSAGRIVYGENPARIAQYLQSMTGNVGVAGGCFSGGEFTVPPFMPVPKVDFQQGPPKHFPVYTHYTRGQMDAILLRDKLDNGEISETEYRRIIGSDPSWPLPNLHMIFNAVGSEIGSHDSNKVWAAYKKVDYVLATPYHMDRPEVIFADLVLPRADCFFEESDSMFGGGGYFVPATLGSGPPGNFFILKQKVIEPVGEAKPMEWINTQLTKRLGCGEEYQPRLIDVLDDPEKWDARFVELQQEAYENWRPVYRSWAQDNGIEPSEPPTWEEFYNHPVFRVPLKRRPNFGFRAQIEDEVPFGTPSGKIEFYSDFVAESKTADHEWIKEIPEIGVRSGACFGGSFPAVIPPMGKWVEPWDSMTSELSKTYPLRVLSPHSFYRQHTAHDNNPWMREETRHALWISVGDAKKRGIKDGDLVRVYNEVGEMLLPAYVTQRLAPGTTIVGYGAWYEQSGVKTKRMPDGIDIRGQVNFLTPSKHYPWINGISHSAHLVQVEKVKGEEEL